MKIKGVKNKQSVHSFLNNFFVLDENEWKFDTTCAVYIANFLCLTFFLRVTFFWFPPKIPKQATVFGLPPKASSSRVHRGSWMGLGGLKCCGLYYGLIRNTFFTIQWSFIGALMLQSMLITMIHSRLQRESRLIMNFAQKRAQEAHTCCH